MAFKIINKKEWIKLDKTQKTIIKKRLDNLDNQIKQLGDFNKIFNNDHIIYKAYKSNFFITKISSVFQFRLLLRYNDGLELHSIYCKNNTNDFQNAYIKQFTGYVSNYIDKLN